MTTDSPTIDRDTGGIVRTEAGRWHVYRNGSPFACAKGAAGLLDDGGPYAAVEAVIDETELFADASRIADRLREKRDAGGRVCLKCSRCYNVEYPSGDNQ